jgi:hypothetical protein
MKPCAPGKIRNPVSKRCVLANGRVGKSLQPKRSPVKSKQPIKQFMEEATRYVVSLRPYQGKPAGQWLREFTMKKLKREYSPDLIYTFSYGEMFPNENGKIEIVFAKPEHAPLTLVEETFIGNPRKGESVADEGIISAEQAYTTSKHRMFGKGFDTVLARYQDGLHGNEHGMVILDVKEP